MTDIQDTPPSSAPNLPPTRVDILDVLRGFALCGILLMNIEWFGRSWTEFESGIKHWEQGLDWWASFFINTFVTGKFWPIFATLFGVGFAMMLDKFKDNLPAANNIMIRRMLCLSVFAVLHYILLWPGDILYVYAMAGIFCIYMFLNLSKRQNLFILIVFAIQIVIVLISGQSLYMLLYLACNVLLLLCILKFYITLVQSERKVVVLNREWQLFPFFIAAFSSAILLSVIAYNTLRHEWSSWNTPLIFSILCAIFFLIAKKGLQLTQRIFLIGGGFYLATYAVILAASWEPVDLSVVHASPKEVDVALKVWKAKKEFLEENSGNVNVDWHFEGKQNKLLKPDYVDNPRVLKMLTNYTSQYQSSRDYQAIRGNHYVTLVRHRLSEITFQVFLNTTIVGTMALGFILPGIGFVRIGLHKNLKDYLNPIRRFAIWGCLIGMSTSLLLHAIASSSDPNVVSDRYDQIKLLIPFADYLCAYSYLAAVVSIFFTTQTWQQQSITGFKGIVAARVQSLFAYLSPLGKMTLTNYLTQSLILAILFYGWGFGLYDLDRTSQVGIAFLLLCFQMIFSRWWLSKFRHGPLEWVWRAVTYWRLPAMRLSA